MKDLFIAYVPVLQTLLWCVLIGFLIGHFKKHIASLLNAFTARIKAGGSLKVGLVEMGATPFTTDTDDAKKAQEEKDQKVEGFGEFEKFGNPDRFRLLFKAQADYWKKSTKAMEVPGGCVVQVTTELINGDGSRACAEALTFVPGVAILLEEQEGRYLGNPASGTESE